MTMCSTKPSDEKLPTQRIGIGTAWLQQFQQSNSSKQAMHYHAGIMMLALSYNELSILLCLYTVPAMRLIHLLLFSWQVT